jgi:hypothetical protein
MAVLVSVRFSDNLLNKKSRHPELDQDPELVEACRILTSSE